MEYSSKWPLKKFCLIKNLQILHTCILKSSISCRLMYYSGWKTFVHQVPKCWLKEPSPDTIMLTDDCDRNSVRSCPINKHKKLSCNKILKFILLSSVTWLATLCNFYIGSFQFKLLDQFCSNVGYVQ